MDRRDFLKLLAATVIGAGVSAVTVTRVFAGRHGGGKKLDKMTVGEAIRALAKRFNAKGSAKSTIATEAIMVMSEAHRDYALVWAGGAVEYWIFLTESRGLPPLVRAARANRKDLIIGAFLKKLKALLIGKNRLSEAESTLFFHECRLAFAEMAGMTMQEVYAVASGSHYKHDLKRYYPAIYDTIWPLKAAA